MCGIVGYIGGESASPILIKGLKKLEYRGYDSAGIAVWQDGGIRVVKEKGRIADLEKKMEQEAPLTGHMGIGHTRWATHGQPSHANAHPHVSNDGSIALVHNGIIENYLELRAQLEEKGYVFVSETDTEVLAHLLHSCYQGNLVEAMRQVLSQVRGSYAVAALSTQHPDEMVAARKDSPLVVGLGKGANYLASDIPAVLEYTRDYYLLEDGDIVLLHSDSVRIWNEQGQEIQPAVYHVDWDMEAAEKGGYDYFMQKEIMEQPRALRDTLMPRIREGRVVIDELHMDDEAIKNIGRIHIIGCGSAWHVANVAKYVMERMARIPVEVDLASEFRYRDPILMPGDLCIIISQSGETADSLAALREAKRHGCRVLSIVNVVASSIARESDDVLYTWAGPEIAVATTKAFSAQLAAVYLLAIHFGQARGTLPETEIQRLTQSLEQLPTQVEQVLEQLEDLKAMAAKYADRENIFFIGRGVDYAISMEGSLKLKEISYIHSEAYAAGELKHGTISLIEDGTLVIALATQDNLWEKMLSNMKEVKSRGARIIALVGEGHKQAESIADDVIYLPRAENMFMPSLDVIPLQIFAYDMALARGCDVDKPRNLAKSVTVE